MFRGYKDKTKRNTPTKDALLAAVCIFACLALSLQASLPSGPCHAPALLFSLCAYCLQLWDGKEALAPDAAPQGAFSGCRDHGHNCL